MVLTVCFFYLGRAKWLDEYFRVDSPHALHKKNEKKQKRKGGGHLTNAFSHHLGHKANFLKL